MYKKQINVEKKALIFIFQNDIVGLSLVAAI